MVCSNIISHHWSTPISQNTSFPNEYLVYFNNAVGIGEHPQHIEEMNKLIDHMATAQDKLDILHNNFSQYECSNNNL